MAEMNRKAYIMFKIISVSTNTSTVTTIENYTKHEIEITTHRKYAAPDRRVGPTL